MENRVRKLLTALAVTAATIGLGAPAQATLLTFPTTIFWTDFGGRHLERANITAPGVGTNTIVDTVPGAASGNPDSLIFDTAGNIVYSMYNGSPGSVRSFNTSNTDTLINSGYSSQATDLALDPSGTSVLLADRGAGCLYRVKLNGTGNQDTKCGFSNLNGLAYDGVGSLFAVTGGTVDRLDATTGANFGTILQTGTVSGNFDGLTWDPFNGTLFAANAGCIEEINKTTLGGIACRGSFSFVDGLESDGAGHIIVADTFAQFISYYDIASGASIRLISAPGLDDIAPVAGLGAPPPPPLPEPATLTLMSAALLGLGAIRRRKKQT